MSTWRGPRGLLAGLVCGLGAVHAHALAFGDDIGLLAVPVVALSLLGGLWLARGPLTLPRLLAANVAGQAALHLVMALPVTGHLHLEGCVTPPITTTLTDGRVLLGHLVVALATTVVSAGADATLCAAARSVVRDLVDRLLPGTDAVAVPARLRPASLDSTRRLVGRRPGSALVIRGPPAGLALTLA